jgi:hypothetical protein
MQALVLSMDPERFRCFGERSPRELRRSSRSFTGRQDSLSGEAPRPDGAATGQI